MPFQEQKYTLERRDLDLSLKVKKKYDVTTVTFIPENGPKKNPLIKLNSFMKNQPTKSPTQISSLKGKEKVGELKSSQTKPYNNQKTTMKGLKSSQNKPKNKQTSKSEVFIKSNQNTKVQQKGYQQHQSQPKHKFMYQNNSRWSNQYRDHTKLTQFPNFVSHNVNYSGRSQHSNFNRLIMGTKF